MIWILIAACLIFGLVKIFNRIYANQYAKFVEEQAREDREAAREKRPAIQINWW